MNETMWGVIGLIVLAGVVYYVIKRRKQGRTSTGSGRTGTGTTRPGGSPGNNQER